MIVHDSNQPDRPPAVRRQDGTTFSERYLKLLCDRSFLSLWSYSGVFKNQLWNGSDANAQLKGEGKELCDLLVVFDDNIIIFSDKYCEFPDTGDLALDWGRWFRRAVAHSAQQLWSAERWIRKHPERIFLDRQCKQPFPITLPDPNKAKIHRIAVAHGAAAQCREHFGGGSGSLLIASEIVGTEHRIGETTVFSPFAIGLIEKDRSYVHVLDDTTLDLVLGTLDTISDFVEYLTEKEELITNRSPIVTAAGEEELLAYYMTHFDENGRKAFVFPDDVAGVTVLEGLWDDFVRSTRYKNWKKANQVSYFWDRLIETFNEHVLDGTQYHGTSSEISDQELAVRLLARESRTRRRFLSETILEMIETTPPDVRKTRVIKSLRPGDPYYVMLFLPEPQDLPYDEYREWRRELLFGYCLATKVEYPDAKDIVGLATESGRGLDGSADVAYLDATDWTADHKAGAQRVKEELARAGLLLGRTEAHRTYAEYPEASEAITESIPQSVRAASKGRDRNRPCPCGSGRKYKKCCGAYR